jgi:hypothetical protein
MSNEEIIIQMPPGETEVREWDDNGEGVTVEQSGEETGKKEKLRIGVIGDNYLADAMRVAFDPKLADVSTTLNDVDDLIEWKPAIVFICNDIPLLKNDTLDDTAIVNVIAKIAKQTGAGLCIKTTINIETIDRILGAVGPEYFQNKIVYAPETGETALDVLSNDFAMYGGHEKALDALLDVIKHCTVLSSTEIKTGSIFEIVYTKLAISGFKAIKQTFFNQMHATIIDCEGANPSIVRRIIESHPVMTDRSVMIPSFIKAQIDGELSMKQAKSFGGEFLNRDARMLVGMTDKIPLLDEAINFRNLKD